MKCIKCDRPINQSMNSKYCGSLCKDIANNDLLEKLAALEHDQWMEWSKEVGKEVSDERWERWRKYWVPYSELTEEVKEYDREWARKVLELVNE